MPSVNSFWFNNGITLPDIPTGIVLEEIFPLPAIPTGIALEEVLPFIIRSVSTSNSWSPTTITKSGGTLDWAVSGGVTIGTTTINDPTFDFSTNTGGAYIDITSPDGFISLTVMDINNLEITDVAIDNYMEFLGTINLSNNLIKNFIYTAANVNNFNISNNPNLITLDISNNAVLTTLDVSSCPNIININISLCNLNSGTLDTIIIDLDTAGLSNGDLNYSSQVGSATPSSASLTAYNNLVTKGWTITGDVPS